MKSALLALVLTVFSATAFADEVDTSEQALTETCGIALRKLTDNGGGFCGGGDTLAIDYFFDAYAGKRYNIKVQIVGNGDRTELTQSFETGTIDFDGTYDQQDVVLSDWHGTTGVYRAFLTVSNAATGAPVCTGDSSFTW